MCISKITPIEFGDAFSEKHLDYALEFNPVAQQLLTFRLLYCYLQISFASCDLSIFVLDSHFS